MIEESWVSLTLIGVRIFSFFILSKSNLLSHSQIVGKGHSSSLNGGWAIVFMVLKKKLALGRKKSIFSTPIPFHISSIIRRTMYHHIFCLHKRLFSFHPNDIASRKKCARIKKKERKIEEEVEEEKA